MAQGCCLSPRLILFTHDTEGAHYTRTPSEVPQKRTKKNTLTHEISNLKRDKKKKEQIKYINVQKYDNDMYVHSVHAYIRTHLDDAIGLSLVLLLLLQTHAEKKEYNSIYNSFLAVPKGKQATERRV